MSPRRVTVRLLSACDNACVFCAQDGAPALDALDDVALHGALTTARALGDEVTFVGGDPTGYAGLTGAITLARELGFYRVGLQTHARALYEDLGFIEIPPYYHNPIPGAHYLRAVL